MNCLYCRYYDKNDAIHAYGTCEPQDKDFHCTHSCNLADEQIKELGLTLDGGNEMPLPDNPQN